LAWFGYLRGERFRDAMRDPESRAAASREVLGYRELPAGYRPMGGFSIPFVMEMAMLSDRVPAPGEEVAGPEQAFGRRGFVYLMTRTSGRQEAQVRAYFRGERERAEFYQEIDQRFTGGEVVGRGRLRAGGAEEVLYVAERGRMELGEGPAPTVLARLLVECPEGSRLRSAMWFEPAPAEDGEGYGGTPADPDALRRFLDHFRLCGT
ncbi:MAG TPA: hypothetical protein VMR44_08260, partial [Thermoanaerobaculia bacterium]|nr:hypothetical protein [Thermoanaerobaculia bacterium]